MGRDGRTDGRSTKVSFNFLHTLWEFRKCIYILKYILKNCHQHSLGFQNLMSSWGVWILILKLLCVNVFLKNHAKSKVFQKHERQQAFLNFFFQFEQTFNIFRKFVKRYFFCKIYSRASLARTLLKPPQTSLARSVP